MLRRVIMENKAIQCPKCHFLAQVTACDVWEDGEAGGTATCNGCVVVSIHNLAPRHLDFSFNCANLIVTSSGGGHTWNYEIDDPYALDNPYDIPEHNPREEKMLDTNKVWVVRHKEAQNLILGIFTSKTQASREYHHIKQVEIVKFDCPHKGESFPVWVVSVGKDKAYRIIKVFPNEKHACKLASSVGGRVQETDAIPSRRARTNIEVGKSFVVLGPCEERTYFVDYTRVGRRLFPGEENNIFPIATFRRAYDRSLPHRIEVLSMHKDDSMAAAKDLSKLTDEEICGMLEYNVDYKLIQINGKWSIDPCLLNQPV